MVSKIVPKAGSALAAVGNATSSSAGGDAAAAGGADPRATGDDAAGSASDPATSAATMSDSGSAAGDDAEGTGTAMAANLKLLDERLAALGLRTVGINVEANALVVIDKLIAETAEMAEIIETLRAELVEQTKALDGATAALTRAKATIKERTLRAPKARKAGPIEGEALGRGELRARLAAADDVEVVFSDGRYELLAVPSIDVAGDVWFDRPFGLLLRLPVELKAPGATVPVTVAGAALFVDGRQVAFQRRSDPVTVPPGGSIRLENDIFF